MVHVRLHVSFDVSDAELWPVWGGGARRGAPAMFTPSRLTQIWDLLLVFKLTRFATSLLGAACSELWDTVGSEWWGGAVTANNRFKINE